MSDLEGEPLPSRRTESSPTEIAIPSDKQSRGLARVGRKRVRSALSLVGQVNALAYWPRKAVYALLGGSGGALIANIIGMILVALSVEFPAYQLFFSLPAVLVGATIAVIIADRWAALPPKAEARLARVTRQLNEKKAMYARNIDDAERRRELTEAATQKWDAEVSAIYAEVESDAHESKGE